MSAIMENTLKFGGKPHQKVLGRLIKMIQYSEQKMTDFHTEFDEADKLYRAYIKETDEDAARRGERDNNGNPKYTTIVIPYAYSILLTAHTYWSSVFLSRTPVHQYTGRHGQGQQNIQALEALIDYQVAVGQQLFPYYVWLLDAPKYGMGIVMTEWAQDRRAVSQIVDEPVTVEGQIIPDKFEKKMRTLVLAGYEGNRVTNLHPKEFLPDPRRPIARFQEGEFCGRKTRLSWNDILRGKAQGRFFNTAHVRTGRHGSNATQETEVTPGIVLPDAAGGNFTSWEEGKASDFPVIEIFVELVPKEWGLGDSEYPEKWYFTLVDRSTIIEAGPYPNYHASYPFDVILYEPEAYTMSARGMLKTLAPLNRSIDWLLNSHMFNVRKHLNDNIVYDPSRIQSADLRLGLPGGQIRLKPSAYGSDPSTAIKQLEVHDITRAHLEDMQLFEQMMQRVSGVTDNIMGLVNQGGRKTATEVRTSSNFSVTRLKTQAELNSALGWAPLSQKLVQNTQQFMSEALTVRVAGDNPVGSQFIRVEPDMISGFYDFVPVDGTLPVDRFAQASLWKEIIASVAQLPMIAEKYDLAKIFGWTAQLSGLKNIKQFEIQSMPQAEIEKQTRTGNIIPMTR